LRWRPITVGPAVKGFQKGIGLSQDGFVSDEISQALVSGMLPG
jgi:hypothetical protein